MKVFRNGVEIEDAKVDYENGQPKFVTTNGVRQKASVFTFQEDTPAKKIAAIVKDKVFKKKRSYNKKK